MVTLEQLAGNVDRLGQVLRRSRPTLREAEILIGDGCGQPLPPFDGERERESPGTGEPMKPVEVTHGR